MFIRYDQVTNRVTFIHMMPEVMSDEDKIGGIIVNSEIPQPSIPEGKDAVLYFNPTTLEFYYQYVDRPLAPEEIITKNIADLQAQNAQMLLALVTGGLM